MLRLATLLVLLSPRLGLLALAADAPDCSSCHAKVAKAKFIHPAIEGGCETCHTDEKKTKDAHTFSLTKKPPELCFDCHDELRQKTEKKKLKHPPFESGECVTCHNPHGSDNKFFLKAANLDELCSNCHESHAKGPVVHKPVTLSCALCHDPHAADGEHFLKAASPDLCLSCHKKIGPLLAAKHQHPPAKKDCLLCHVPHGGEQAGLLKSAQVELCSGCHAQIAEELKNPWRHGAIAKGQCRACHEPHGSKNPRLLVAAFPEGFYNRYKPEVYALCFSCHRRNLAKDRFTRTATGFRDGDRNLHQVHVNSPKGRSCKACHAFHAAALEKLVRSSMPFGSSTLPIGFTKTADGGSCQPGCHRPQSYSRSKLPDL